MKVKDITGQKFEKLLVISRKPNKNGRAMWLCLCDCGNYTIVSGKQALELTEGEV